MISSMSVSTARWTVTQLGCSDDLHLSFFTFRLDGIFSIPFFALFDDRCFLGVGGGLIAWVVRDVGVFGHFRALHGRIICIGDQHVLCIKYIPSSLRSFTKSILSQQRGLDIIS